MSKERQIEGKLAQNNAAVQKEDKLQESERTAKAPSMVEAGSELLKLQRNFFSLSSFLWRGFQQKAHTRRTYQ